MFTLHFNGNTYDETFSTKTELWTRLREFTQDDLNAAYGRPVAVSHNGTTVANIGNIGIASAKTDWKQIPIL